MTLEEEMRELSLFVNLTNRIKVLEHALELATRYVAKGVADGAYDGCVAPAENALKYLYCTLGDK